MIVNLMGYKKYDYIGKDEKQHVGILLQVSSSEAYEETDKGNEKYGYMVQEISVPKKIWDKSGFLDYIKTKVGSDINITYDIPFGSKYMQIVGID